jgi:iron complex transport system ATP-binding protein
MITFKNVTVYQENHEILKEISGQISFGKMVGVLGPNGAGKTTFLKMLAGLLPYQAGDVLWGDIPLSQIPLERLARQRAFLPQGTFCAWRLTVVEVILLQSALHPKDKERNQEKLESILKQMSLKSLKDRDFHTLSTGEKSRVLLSRALLNDPQVLFADESIANLDPFYQHDIVKKLKDYTVKGNTVILALHDIQMARTYCEEVILLKEGKIYAYGLGAEVLTPQALKDVFKVDPTFYGF